ncbi:hypothetical protein BJ322DRAFT_385619 [Thelephora terrestris]|uniref:Uncharacterized protein n=1 Tax=Thelephora terrestris TaxID=56493 RepID=A0A9P6HPW8_9AGAM|nr:hypothetical protein BJ322DRAFT_385619 [Thelephora terrestris]
MAARFFTHGEDGKGSLGPIVIWIATHPDTTTAENAHDVSPDIISLLEKVGVEGAVIEWYEGTVETLAGPPLLRVTLDTDPTYYVRRFLTAVLGMPITTQEREDDDAQGSVGFFFHENKSKRGEASARVPGVSNRHVLHKTNTDDYQFKGAGAPRQLVRVCGSRRFQRGVNEIKARIGRLGSDAELFVTEIAELQLQVASEDPDEVEEAEAGVTAKQAKLAEIKQHIGLLEAFDKEVNAQWSDIERRNMGHVDWAPKISVDVEGNRYTLDVGTFELDEAKFKPHFKGNVIDLGAKYTPGELTDKFYPLHNTNTRTLFNPPPNRQLRVKGIVTRELLANPDCFDSNDEPCLIVLKDGGASDLTVGNHAGLEAYLADDFGQESVELAIYNYNKQSGDFSAKGDSGSLIVDGKGNMLGLLHSGMPRGGSNHVTFATPAWWIVQKIKDQYPHADFYRTSW